MPLGTPALATTQVGGSGDNVTSASFTPTEGDLLVAFVMGRGVNASEPTISDSISSTWTAVPSSFIDAGLVVAKLFYQTIGASPAARTVTGTSTSATQVGLAIVSVASGAITTNFVSDTDPNGDPSLTMAAYGAGSACLGFYVANAGSATTPPTDFLELYDVNIATNLRSSVSYDAVDPTTSLAWVGGGSDTIGYGLEIEEAGAGTQNISGALYEDIDTFYAATITTGAVNISGALYVDDDTFYAATVALGGAAQEITGSLFTNTNTFHTATVSSVATITGSLYVDADTFYAATVTVAGGGGGGGGDFYTVIRRRRR